MKIKDLIKKLASYPEDHEVLLAADAEGNSFSKLDELSSCRIEEGSSNWAVETETVGDWDGEEDDYPGDDAVILRPV